ncbi:MAG: redoxin domain-containing protein [Acidobacteria bacterium]|nr:redoxin domain-containing protein [Acidobacteriota bacterium]MBI3654901.1 redoxin domain-containing protein [Acidobacteriota bacterium]
MTKSSRASVMLGVGLAMALMAACTFFGPSGSTVGVGQPLPDFTLTDLDGRPFNVADHRGKVILINGFATW